MRWTQNQAKGSKSILSESATISRISGAYWESLRVVKDLYLQIIFAPMEGRQDAICVTVGFPLDDASLKALVKRRSILCT